MRHLAPALTVAFALLFVVALGFSARYTLSLSRTFADAPQVAEDRTHHISLYLPDSDSLFFSRIRRGAERVAAEHDVALSMHATSSAFPAFDFAYLSGIDGVIVFPTGSERSTREVLERLDTQDIPVVLIERTIADDAPWTVVGTNTFDVGRRIGEVVSSLEIERPRVAVVYSDKSPSVAAEMELVELGIATSVGDQLGAPVSRRRTGLNPLDAETLTYQIVRNEPDLSVLVFTDTSDTLAALQVIIDLNLVGRVEVIGFGMNATLREYLDRGVLAASIVVDAEHIGAEAVRVAASLIREVSSPGYVDTGVQIEWGTR